MNFFVIIYTKTIAIQIFIKCFARTAIFSCGHRAYDLMSKTVTIKGEKLKHRWYKPSGFNAFIKPLAIEVLIVYS